MTYTANTATRTYGAANPTLSGNVSGFVGSETLASATAGAAAFGTTASTTSNVGQYGITGSGLTANNGNYTFSQASGNATALAVTPASLIVTASNASKTYDGNLYTGGAGVTYSGFVNSETASVLNLSGLAYGGNAQNSRNAGSYVLTAGGLTANNGNYSLSYSPGTLTTAQASLSLAASAGSKTYDGTASSTLAPVATGLVAGRNAGVADSVTNLSESYNSANVNATTSLRVNSGYVIADGNGGANYAVTLQTASGSITAAATNIAPNLPNVPNAGNVQQAEVGTNTKTVTPPLVQGGGTGSGTADLNLTVRGDGVNLGQ